MGKANDTISAIATANGHAGVGIVRVSGPQALTIAEQITQKKIRPRHAHYGAFFSDQQDIIDQGITISFPGPHSFTGEDVVEFQGHGGPLVLDHLLKRTLECGARVAEPGEFSQRAFLNDKIDLLQAEAIADLIASSTEQASRSAMRSLSGAFSKQVDALIEKVTGLRCYVEAAIDFPEEEIDFLSDQTVTNNLAELLQTIDGILKTAKRGRLLREGLTLAIIGKPNAGKSSLLNCLSERDSAIVNAEAGTTRDVVRENIHIDGIPLHIIDTAGLRETDNSIEQEGIRRAKQEIERADILLYLRDITTQTENPKGDWLEQELASLDISITRQAILLVDNKIDLLESATPKSKPNDKKSNQSHLYLSTKTGQGIDELKRHIAALAGEPGDHGGDFIARRRHIDALQRAQQCIADGESQLRLHGAGELLADDLRAAQEALGELTGQISSDELLGEIFSSFCIGK